MHKVVLSSIPPIIAFALFVMRAMGHKLDPDIYSPVMTVLFVISTITGTYALLNIHLINNKIFRIVISIPVMFIVVLSIFNIIAFYIMPYVMRITSYGRR